MDIVVALGGERLTQLETSVQDEERNLIMKSAPKSCDLDPLSTPLLKQVLKFHSVSER